MFWVFRALDFSTGVETGLKINYKTQLNTTFCHVTFFNNFEIKIFK